MITRLPIGSGARGRREPLDVLVEERQRLEALIAGHEREIFRLTHMRAGLELAIAICREDVAA